MKYQNLFSGKEKKNISLCRLLKILPTVLSVNEDDISHNVRQDEKIIQITGD